MGTYALFVLAALVASVLIGLLYKRLWDQHDHLTLDEKWRERERLLDRGRTSGPEHEILEQRSRPAGTRDRDSLRGLQVATFARVLFIVARDQRELVGFLHKDFAAEEAEDVIEILMDRRQSPQGHGAQPREADGRRDPRRNRPVSTNLREIGCAFVRQLAALPETALSMTHFRRSRRFWQVPLKALRVCCPRWINRPSVRTPKIRTTNGRGRV